MDAAGCCIVFLEEFVTEVAPLECRLFCRISVALRLAFRPLGVLSYQLTGSPLRLGSFLSDLPL